jgi:hypothetical protein
MGLVDKVLDTLREKYGFGYADVLRTVQSQIVPILYAQVREDEYTFAPTRGRNDIEDVIEVTPTKNQLIWIGPNEAIPFGTGKRFDGYEYFNAHPGALLSFLDGKFS